MSDEEVLVPIAPGECPYPVGTRVRVKPGHGRFLSFDASGRLGTVTSTMEVCTSPGVKLDGDRQTRWFGAEEVEPVDEKTS